MGRAPCCDKANVKKGPWSPEEDSKLKSYIETNGTGGNWIALPQKIGLKRCGKSCRLRWLNYLRPNIRHGGFSEEEDKIILSLYVSIGSRWSIIAAQLPGRTDNDIKNYWNTRLKKKLLGKQRKNQHARRGIDLIKQEENPLGNNSTIPPTSSNVINNHNQTPYWSQFSMPNTISSPSYLTQVGLNHGYINDQTSMRKLLMKVEENCYGDNNNNNLSLDEQFISQYSNTYPNIPLISSLHQPNYNDNVISSFALEGILSTSTSTSTCQITNPSHFNTHQGVGEDMGVLGGRGATFPSELEELMSSKTCQKMDELDFLYGDYNGVSNLVNNNNNDDGSTSDTTTCGGESTGWGEMKYSLVSIPNKLDSNCNNEYVHGIVHVCQIEENLRYSSGL